MILIEVDVTAIIISAIGAVVSLGTAALALIIKKRVEEVHNDVNGKMEHLLKVTGDAKRGEGVAEGVQQQKDESETTAHNVVQAIKDDKDIRITKSE